MSLRDPEAEVGRAGHLVWWSVSTLRCSFSLARTPGDA